MPYIVRENGINGYLYMHKRLGGGYFMTPSKRGAYKFSTIGRAEDAAVSHLGQFFRFAKILKVK